MQGCLGSASLKIQEVLDRHDTGYAYTKLISEGYKAEMLPILMLPRVYLSIESSFTSSFPHLRLERS